MKAGSKVPYRLGGKSQLPTTKIPVRISKPTDF